MATYSVTDYLLDRANIHDTITSMFWHVDRHNWDMLSSSSFTENIVMDYTALAGGGKPSHTTAIQQVEDWKVLLKDMETSIHVVTGILSDLPQPAVDVVVQPPNEAKCSCNSLVTHVRRHAQGDPVTTGGGYYEFKLVKTATGLTGNPWRISEMKATPSFMTNREAGPTFHKD
ncbi:SnoaL-like domain-containing protein [Mycena rebaudengoi]|nr:SnoaL-like domain-containing protein [Mycena rebaudengoi]